MAKLAKRHVNKWDMPSWASKNEKAGGSVAIEGVLFSHPDPARLFLMTEASGAGVRFELLQSDIEDIGETSQKLAFLDQAFDVVRIVVKLDAPVTRVSLHTVGALVEYPDRLTTNLAGETMKIKNTVLASAIMR